MGDTPDEDLPDMSSDYWVKRIPKAKVSRGRPKALTPKVSTTLRLDPDVIEAFKADGPGWQSRMNAALRKAAGLGP
ncbi:BrnA antitoxin family protein [Marivita hallyeonensis]|uniref:BrnA antitoxin family protein n=1 Tax=Marivita hallyeonensis TaxID=996342 RepID=UPI000B290BC7|nr:BrnA antitoxin family protein [Marivita hallyeonensis]